MSELLGELIGTMLLIVLGNGVVGGVVLKGTKAEGSGWMVITMGWGLAVAMAVYAVGSISGAHINPAVTLGLAAVGEFPWAKVPAYIIAQLVGAFLGAVMVWLHYLPHWKATPAADQLAVFSTGPAHRISLPNLMSEILGTFILVLALMFIGANRFAEGLNPLIIGFLIVSIGLSLGSTTGYAINPARDLGPRIAHALLPISGKGSSDWAYAWVPIVGPILGGVYGALFYRAVFQGMPTVVFWAMSLGLIVIALLAIRQQLGHDKASSN